jgi:hypothetical protein
MGTTTRALIGTLLLPFLAFVAILLLVAARAIGGMSPLTALLGVAGLALYLAVTVAGATLFGDAAARETA